MNRIHIAGAAGLIALALPSAASAHVTLQPSQATAGSYVVENVRVPNERDDASTTKVDVQLPPGFAAVSYEATPGWTVKVVKRTLDTPVQTDDGELTEEVARITWTAASDAAAIAPGQFRDFPLSVKIPEDAGSELTFKALQTYSSGEVVRWIGAPDSDTPAPRVAIAAATGAGHDEPADAEDVASEPATPVPASDSEDGDGASQGLAIAALAAGIAGSLLSGAALMRRRA